MEEGTREGDRRCSLQTAHLFAPHVAVEVELVVYHAQDHRFAAY
jgi:hypothetical protein